MAIQPPVRSESSPIIYTVGHSTRPIEDFIGLLDSFGVTCLVDVRTVPRSRRNPQFNKDSLPQALEPAGIRYTHFPELGGLRKPGPDSANTAWRNDSFRGYADYMQTAGFAQGLDQLLNLAGQEAAVAVMCAEAVPWRCHRSLIGDALLARGFQVVDILGPSKAQPHRLTPFAKVEGEQVTYPGES
jgi:uncharacterized protein (DUF488 family)